jgi:nicotinic acid phosphoribosyltransferase
MNDLGFTANNFVMKATNVDGIDTVKLSDSVGKHTGPTEQVERYIALKDARIAVNAILQQKELVS